MDYQTALAWLYGLQARGVHLNLDRIEAALEVRGHPERGLRVVHVAGTNGKGSVSAFTERILRAAGYRTGLFTSPHLHRYAERFRVNGESISDDEIARRATSLRDAASSMPRLTFFEHSTLLAFEAFVDHGCDVVVLEVGLGGRLDATNVIESPLSTVVTRIAFDHTRILGDTLSQIAGEKAGIFKRGAPAIIGAREPEARRALVAAAVEKRALGPYVLGEDFDARAEQDGVVIRLGAHAQHHVLGLEGAHQAENAAIAVAGLRYARGLDIDEASVAGGLRDAQWPGRLETISGTPDVLVDCAHNPDGCEALAAHLARRPRGRTVLLFGAMADKAHLGMLAPFDGLVDHVVYAVPAMERSAALESLRAVREGELAPSVAEGLARARQLAGAQGLVVVAGSIFVVNEARAQVLGITPDPSIGM